MNLPTYNPNQGYAGGVREVSLMWRLSMAKATLLRVSSFFLVIVLSLALLMPAMVIPGQAVAQAGGDEIYALRE